MASVLKKAKLGVLIDEENTQSHPTTPPDADIKAEVGLPVQRYVPAPPDDNASGDVTDLRCLLVEPPDDATAASNARHIVAPLLYRKLETLANAKRELLQFVYDLHLTLAEATPERVAAVFEGLEAKLSPEKLFQSIAQMIVPEAVVGSGAQRHNAQNQVGRVVAAMKAAQQLQVGQGQLAEKIREAGSVGAFVKTAKDIEAANWTSPECGSDQSQMEPRARTLAAAIGRSPSLHGIMRSHQDILFIKDQPNLWLAERGWAFCVVFRQEAGSELRGYLPLSEGSFDDVDEVLVKFEDLLARDSS